MSLLAEIKSIAEGLNIKVETGAFSDKVPDEYIVLTPLSDGFDMHCDNMPTFDRQEVRISIFSKGNYSALKYKLVTALFRVIFQLPTDCISVMRATRAIITMLLTH